MLKDRVFRRRLHCHNCSIVRSPIRLGSRLRRQLDFRGSLGAATAGPAESTRAGLPQLSASPKLYTIACGKRVIPRFLTSTSGFGSGPCDGGRVSRTQSSTVPRMHCRGIRRIHIVNDESSLSWGRSTLPAPVEALKTYEREKGGTEWRRLALMLNPCGLVSGRRRKGTAVAAAPAPASKHASSRSSQNVAPGTTASSRRESRVAGTGRRTKLERTTSARIFRIRRRRPCRAGTRRRSAWRS